MRVYILFCKADEHLGCADGFMGVYGSESSAMSVLEKSVEDGYSRKDLYIEAMEVKD